MSDVYYKIFKDEDGLTVVCLQDFDEADYDQSKFYSQHKYATEKEAQSIINAIVSSGFMRLEAGKSGMVCRLGKNEYEWVWPEDAVMDNTLINEIRNEQFNKGIEYALNILATEAIKEFPRGVKFLEAYEVVENGAKNKGWLKK